MAVPTKPVLPFFASFIQKNPSLLDIASAYPISVLPSPLKSPISGLHPPPPNSVKSHPALCTNAVPFEKANFQSPPPCVSLLFVSYETISTRSEERRVG